MTSPTVVVAPDSFKGTYGAPEVAAAIAAGLEEGGVRAVRRPIGDGGEGTLDALVDGLPAQLRTAVVEDPLGRPVEARFALLRDEPTAIVEMAEADGLHRVAPHERDAWAAHTRGTGQLIAAAVAAGAEHVLVTVGGSATSDGGAGAIEVLQESGVAPRLTVLCDVTSPWADAASVFGAQKGADAGTIERLAERLDALAERAPRDPRGVPMTGAAGGLAGGLWAFRGAELVPGAERVLDAIGFDGLLAGAALVVTGEGALDEQTFAGKAVGVVAARCRAAGVPCHAVVGTARITLERARGLGLAGVQEATDADAMRRAGRRLAGDLLGAGERSPAR